MTLQIGGPIGPFRDNVQQRQVAVVVVGTCEYRTNGPVADPAQLEQHVRTQLLGAMNNVIGRKMESGELTFRHLGTGDVAAVVPEIIAASGLQQAGVSIGNLAMSFGIDGHAPQPVPGGQAMSAAQPQHNLAAGTFDMGGGQQLRVKINGKSPENFLKDKASSMIWGWIIGAIIIGLLVIGFVGVGIYVYVVAKSSTASTGVSKTGVVAKWNGKSTFECSGNDVVVLSGVTATAGVKADANCQLTMTGVNITAPIAIEAGGNAKVIMTGGSVTASTNAVVASANAKVDLVGTKVTGKAKMSGLAKVTGVP